MTTSEPVTVRDVRVAAVALGLGGRPICVHSSLRSFGRVEGGARAVVDGLLAEGCTVLVPTFSWHDFVVDPLPHQQPPRNGAPYVEQPGTRAGTHRVYTPDANDLDRETMGAIAAAVLAMPDRFRGDHPLRQAPLPLRRRHPRRADPRSRGGAARLTGRLGRDDVPAPDQRGQLGPQGL